MHFANNVGSTTLTNDQGLAFGWNKSNGGGESTIIANQGGGNAGGLVFATNTSGGSYAERMRIDSAGTMILRADGAANLGRIQFSSQAATYQILGGNNIGYLGYKTGGYHRFFGSDGAEDMRIDSSGRLLIGTTSTTPCLLYTSPSPRD